LVPIFSATRVPVSGALDAELKDVHAKKRQHEMTIAADRITDLEVRVSDTIYVFDNKADADAFQQCLGNDSVETCNRNHAPVSTRSALNDTGADGLAPGSIISPSMGGMP
jgi:hypothetical protein